MEYKCRYCGKICKNQNSLRNHERLCKLNPNHQEHTGFKYGWSKGLNKNTNESLKKTGEKLRSKYLKVFIPYCCEKCGKLVEHKYGSGRFCSRQCANSRRHTDEQKEKISKGVIKHCKEINKNIASEEKVCPICGSIYYTNNKTCSKKCGQKYRIQKGVSEETKKKLSQAVQKRIKNGTHKGWTTRNIESYAESFFKKVLENNNISYEFNKPIEKNKLGIQENGCYFLDFALPNKIDLEIDGKQHKLEDRRAHDKIRDERLTNNGWKVYRIEWKSLPKNNEYIKNEIDKFLEWYKKEG